MKVLLVLAYLSASGIPSIETHKIDSYKECLQTASYWHKRIKVGSGRAWCKRISVPYEEQK